MFLDFILILVLNVVLAFIVWLIISISWNNIVREELRVRSDLVWAWLLGIVVMVANGVVIAHLMQVAGPMLAVFSFNLLGNAGLIAVTWFLIAIIWNNVVREKLRVMSNIAWAYLWGIVVAIANAAVITHLMQ